MILSNRYALALLLAATAASAQIQTIYIPSSGGGSGSRRPKVQIQGPLTVKSANVTHIISDAQIIGASEGGISGLDALGLNNDIANVIAFRVGTYLSREEIEQKKADLFRVVFPIGAVERLAVVDGDCSNKKGLAVTLRSGATVPLKLCEDASSFWFHFSGKEDLKDFGKAEFRGSLSEITEVLFPEGGLTAIPAKSSISATVTELSGRVHELTDVRLKDGKLRLDRAGATVDVDVANLARIDLLRNDQCAVTLKSGTQQDFKCTPDVGGKASQGWYEIIPHDSLKSVVFK